MSNKPGYLFTDIGELPDEWGAVKLKDHVKRLIVPMRDKPKRFEGDIPWCRIEDFDGKYLFTSKSGKFVNQQIINEMNLKVFPLGTVICSCSARLGRCAIAGTELVTNQTFIGIVPDETFDKEFLYYLMESYADRLQLLSTGSTISYLSRKEFANFVVAKPPFFEQQQIASILSTIDSSIQKSDEIITKTQQLKKGLMQQLFTQGIGHTRFKQTEVGRKPEEWGIFRLEDVAEIFGGATPSTNVADYWNGRIPFVTPTDVTKLRDDNFLKATLKSITKAGFNSISAKCVPAGSILVTSRATIGLCCINTIPVVTNQGFFNLVCKSELFNLFALYLARSLKREFERLSDGSTFKELARRSARKVLIALPPLSEQKKIASILSTLDDRIKIEMQRNEELHRLKKGLATDLLTGKVRVKVT